MSGWKNVSSSKCQCAKMSVHQNVKVSKCLGVASGLSAKWRVSKCRRTRLGRLYQEPRYFFSLNPQERDYFGYWLQGSKHSTTFVVCNLNFFLEKCFFPSLLTQLNSIGFHCGNMKKVPYRNKFSNTLHN